MPNGVSFDKTAHDARKAKKSSTEVEGKKTLNGNVKWNELIAYMKGE